MYVYILLFVFEPIWGVYLNKKNKNGHTNLHTELLRITIILDW